MAYDLGLSVGQIVPWAIAAVATGYGVRMQQLGRTASSQIESALPTRPASADEPEPVDAASDDSLNLPDPLMYQALIIRERFKSGFLARTAHELRSPINSLVGLHQLILEDLCESPEEEREFVGQARDAAMKLLQRLDTLIAASKLDSGRERPRVERLSVAELFRVIENLTLLQAANHNLRLKVTMPDEETTASGDGRWLRTLLVSLVEDAISNTALGFVNLWCEQGGENRVALCLSSDRPVGEINLAVEADGYNANPDLADPSTIRLSTELVLSTAQMMLPPMDGRLEILASQEDSAASVLKLWLPS
ncbi:MAG: HAMP domain-containing sensor histidine kinase [Cyanobacteria bacterium J06628_6]